MLSNVFLKCLYTGYRKVVEKWKLIENGFYAGAFPNDDLRSEF